MFRFEHPYCLYALGLILVFWLVYFLFSYRRKQQIKRLGDSDLIQQMLPNSSKNKRRSKLILFTLAFACFVLALANPQFGSKKEKVKRKGVDIIVALDISNSMLAEDIAPNRIARAKRLITQLIEKLRNDRVGLIIFAGNAYLQVPLTIDYSAIKMFLSNIGPGMISSQGTNFDAAIRLAQESFNQEESKHKALLIISDGEDHETDALVAAEEAKETGVTVYTVGVGTTKGAPIPERNDYKKDADGKIVLSRLNESMLEDLADKGNGEYYNLSNKSGISTLITSISEMEQKEFEEQVYTDYDDKFQIFLLFGIIFMLIEMLLPYVKSDWLNELKIFKS